MKKVAKVATQPTNASPSTAKPASAMPSIDLSALINVKQQEKRRNKAQENSLKMRTHLWPEVTADRLWHRKVNDGYSTIPRTLPLLMNLINDLSKGVAAGKSVPAGRAYLVLWCRLFDEALVKIDSEAVAAAEAGYFGERNVTTWREHLRVLQELGFIDCKQGPAGPYQYVLVYNPYQVVEALKSQVQGPTYTALYQRALEIGAGNEFKIVTIAQPSVTTAKKS